MQYRLLDETPIDMTPRCFEPCDSPHLVHEMVKTGLGLVSTRFKVLVFYASGQLIKAILGLQQTQFIRPGCRYA